MQTNRTLLRIGLLSLSTMVAPQCMANTYHDQYILSRLTEVRLANPVPSLTAAVWSNSGIAAKGVVGRRKQGVSTLAQIYDRYHIGSITKPITSTLIARLIELGLFTSYSTSLNSTHPSLFQSGNYFWGQYRTAPLLSYMSHVDGMHYQPENEPADEYASLGVTNLIARRKAYTKDAIRDQPYGAVGVKRVYAGGHIVAASMLESITGSKWETLVDQYVFTPLGMNSAGFGPMSSTTSVTGPYEHSWNGTTAVPRVWPANYAYEPHAPAGRNVHCNIQELVKFGASHLSANSGATRILNDQSLQTLRTVHYQGATDLDNNVVDMTPAWFLSTRLINGSNYQGYWHNGDNTFNYAWLEVIPGQRLSFAIATNLTGGDSSPSRSAINAMKTHCIDIHEHYNMIAIMGRDLSNSASAGFGAGSVGSMTYLNDRNFSTGASFNSAGSAIKLTFGSAKTIVKAHLSNEDGKIRKYAIDKWVAGSPVSGWVPIKEVTTFARDVALTVPTSTSTQFRLRVLEATSWPVKVDEFWLMPY